MIHLQTLPVAITRHSRSWRWKSKALTITPSCNKNELPGQAFQKLQEIRKHGLHFRSYLSGVKFNYINRKLSQRSWSNTNKAIMPEKVPYSYKINQSINHLHKTAKQEVSLKTCCKSSMTYNLEITQRPTLLNAQFFFFLGGGGRGSVFIPNVNLQSILYPQQTYKEQNWSEDCVIRRHTKTQVRSLCRPITPFYYSTVSIYKQR